MDQVKIGKFIAALRREAGLTQNALGDKLGVTNKTVSRWENGNYMPDIEMMDLLAKEFHVSINELLAGERRSDEASRIKADKPTAAAQSGAFSFAEKQNYLKQKWRREHIPLFVLLSIILIAAMILPFVVQKPWFAGLAPLVAFVEYGFQNNRMMIYVEHHLYGE